MTTIKIRWVLVYILLDIAPDVYGPYVIKERKGINKLIVQCQNGTYGIMTASLMWIEIEPLCPRRECQNGTYGIMTASLIYYKKFMKSLEDEGYEFNHYDPCVDKNITKGIQMNVCLHVDYCKLSHKIPKVV